MKLHLHQFLAKSGKFKSKSATLSAVKEGKIMIDGIPITSPMYRFNPEKKKVAFMGEEIKIVAEKIYIILNKPEGYLSTRLSAEVKRLGKRSFIDLLKKDAALTEDKLNMLFPVGRLDESTSGLLIITNDGPLGYKIASPDNNIEKTYRAELRSPLGEKEKKQIESGVTIRITVDGKRIDYKTKPAKIILSKNPNEVFITIKEGKHHEVRKIMQATGNHALKLERIAIGRMNLDALKLPPGEFMFVKKEFIISKL